jgi:hypothetical protein
MFAKLVIFFFKETDVMQVLTKYHNFMNNEMSRE